MLNNVEVVDALIQSGANVNLQDGNWRATPLLYASGSEGHPEVIARILKANPNLEIADKYGRTPLIMASHCYKGAAAVNLRLLLNAGANVNAKDNQGATALIYARQAGDQESVDLLIEHGAKTNLP